MTSARHDPSTESRDGSRRLKGTRHLRGRETGAGAMGGGTRTDEQEAQGTHPPRRHHDRGLLLIGFFKLAEAVLFFFVGLGVVHFIHRSLGDEVVRLAERLRIDPDGRFVPWVIDHLDRVTAHRLRQIGVATFFYAGLRIVEGVGLVMEKLWAEYLTLGVTAAFLPWELYEIARHPDWIRIAILVINLAVLNYLVWQLRRSGRLTVKPRGRGEHC